jgi:uncharacterized protein YceK
MKTIVIAIAACLVLVGCSSVPVEQVQAEAAKIGYGEPLPSNWQDMVKNYIAASLKDPMSAVYQFGEPAQGMIQKAPIRGGGLDVTGYLVSVLVNAKNSYGGYTGFKEYQFLIRDGKIIRRGERIGDTLVWY